MFDPDSTLRKKPSDPLPSAERSIMPDPNDLAARFAGKRILVVGDLMLDEYLMGDVRRISPEAPVPVVDLQRHKLLPGGAANAAANVAGLGAVVLLLGVVGADQAGERLLALLGEHRIDSSGILLDPERVTTCKTRVIAHNQQVVRLDREDRSSFSEDLRSRLLQAIRDRIDSVDACLLSDYAKGLVSPALAQGLIASAREHNKPIVVDPKGSDPAKYRGATLVKPNLHELSLLLRREVHSTQEVLEAGAMLCRELDCRALLVTRGASGMSLFEANASVIHIAAQAREVFDVTGAGDTVAATLVACMASGASFEQAARLASRAAAITVGKLGTAAITLAELFPASA